MDMPPNCWKSQDDLTQYPQGLSKNEKLRNPQREGPSLHKDTVRNSFDISYHKASEQSYPEVSTDDSGP